MGFWHYYYYAISAAITLLCDLEKLIYSSNNSASYFRSPLLGFLIRVCLDKSWTQSTHFVLLSGDPVTEIQTRLTQAAMPLGGGAGEAGRLAASLSSTIRYMCTPLTSLSTLCALPE